MTNSDLQQRAELAAAFYAGKPVEWKPLTGLRWYELKPTCAEEKDWFNPGYIFRLPPTPEQLRLEANARVKAEWEASGKKGVLECRALYDNKIGAWEGAEGNNFGDDEVEYRFTPAPTVEPWTFETAPYVAKVRQKTDGKLFRTEANPASVSLRGPMYREISYTELRDGFEQYPGGEPCGAIGGAR